MRLLRMVKSKWNILLNIGLVMILVGSSFYIGYSVNEKKNSSKISLEVAAAVCELYYEEGVLVGYELGYQECEDDNTLYASNSSSTYLWRNADTMEDLKNNTYTVEDCNVEIDFNNRTHQVDE